MTKVVLLKQLKEFTEQRTKDLLLPVASQKDDKEPPEDRAADVYRARRIVGQQRKRPHTSYTKL